MAPTLELEDLEGEPAIMAKVDGKNVKLVLATRWPKSYLLGAKGTVKSVIVGSKPLVKATFLTLPKAQMYPHADGVLGIDALKGMCFAIDPLWRRMELLPQPKIGLEGAKKYFAKLPAWGAPGKVVRLTLGQNISGVPIMKTTLGGKKAILIFSLSTYNSTLGPVVKLPKDPEKRVWLYQPNVVFPGLTARWLPYGAYAQWDTADEGAHGIAALDAYGSRRVIVDLADNAAYVEELSEDVRTAMFLSDRARLPILVSGNEASIGAMPGIFEADSVGELDGYKLTQIAAVPIAEWLKDFRLGTPEASARLSKRFLLFDDDFEITVVSPEGEEKTIPIPRRDGPSDTMTR